MEGAIEVATVARGATAPIEEATLEDTVAEATAAITGATLRDTTTVGTITREAITDGIPGTTTEDGLPTVQPLGSSLAVSWSGVCTVPSGGPITMSPYPQPITIHTTLSRILHLRT